MHSATSRPLETGRLRACVSCERGPVAETAVLPTTTRSRDGLAMSDDSPTATAHMAERSSHSCIAHRELRWKLMPARGRGGYRALAARRRPAGARTQRNNQALSGSAATKLRLSSRRAREARMPKEERGTRNGSGGSCSLPRGCAVASVPVPLAVRAVCGWTPRRSGSER